MVYVELWFDAERDRDWKITIWEIDQYDFDPFTAPYVTLNLETDNPHIARELQLEIVRDLKQTTQVVANAYIDRSRFLIRPKWVEELLSPFGRIKNGQAEHLNKNRKDNSRDRRTMFSNLQQTYKVWFSTERRAIIADCFETNRIRSDRSIIRNESGIS